MGGVVEVLVCWEGKRDNVVCIYGSSPAGPLHPWVHCGGILRGGCRECEDILYKTMVENGVLRLHCMQRMGWRLIA